MGVECDRNTVMQRHRCYPLIRYTEPAFLINALILMTLIFNVVASASYVGRNLKQSTDHYQSNYEDGTPLSAGYTLSQNYYRVAPNPDAVVESSIDIDGTSTRGTNANSFANFEDLQQFRNMEKGGFMPTTITEPRQNYIDNKKATPDEHARYTEEAMAPQIGGIQPAGQYTGPVGKIDYEMNAANYNVATDDGGDGRTGDIPSNEYRSNDAHNIAAMHDLTQQYLHRRQYKQHHEYEYQQQRQQELQQQYQQHRQQKHHQLTYGTESVPKAQSAIDVNFNIDSDIDTATAVAATGINDSDRIVAFENSATHTTTPTEAKQINNVDEQNLLYSKVLQHGNYHQQSKSATDLYNEEALSNRKQPTRQQLNAYAAYQTTPIHHSRYQHPYSSHQINNRNTKPQIQNLSTLTQSKNSFRPALQNSRSLSLNEIDPGVAFEHPESPLPLVTNTVRHTPASLAAISGVPLSRHVQVVNRIPVPNRNRQLVPFNQTVNIEIPDPIITTVPKPVPINVNVPNVIAVPKDNIIRIPIERIKPVPVERAVPFLVDRRVPYTVERQIAKPVYVPYPVRVPVLTTFVHKLPSHQPIQHNKPRRVFFKEFVTKKNPFG